MSAQLEAIVPAADAPDSGLRRLFNPRAIAIVGASPDAATINGQPLRNLRGRGYRGAIYPVNPKHAEIAGETCYASVAALPEAPDLAIILLGASRAVQAVAECGKKGIPYAIVIGAGFAEVGDAGEQLQRELVAAARAHGVRVVGPNCIGLMNLADDVFAGFGPVFGMAELRSGGVSMVSQSGGFGFGVVNMAEELGVGFRYVVSTGNEADVTSLELMGAMVDDPQTSVIAGYFEGIKDARQIPQLARRALDARKPIVVWKVGNSPEGKRAAASHTGNLGGANELYQAAFDQFGWITVDDVEELVDCARAFERNKLPGGKRVGIVTVSGGAGVLLADRCAAYRLEVPQLSPRTHARLKEVLPAFASAENPVDVTASILNDAGLLRAALTVILDDERIDSLIVVASSVEGPAAARIADELVRLDAATDKPVVVSWTSRESRVGDAYERLRTARVPLYRTPTRACRAVAALSRFADAVRRHERDRDELIAVQPAPTRATLVGHGAVAEHEAKQILAIYGLRPTAERLARDVDDAVRCAAAIGYPVAIKVQSKDLPHKTEAGAVRIGIGDEASLRRSHDEILANARRYAPAAAIDGVLVQEMVTGGVEMILGAVHDARFGPALMLGLGGVFTEVLKDVVFRFAPIGPSAARDMVDALRGRPVLDGVRGAPPADVDALVAAIVDVSRLVDAEQARLVELDINPLVVLPRGEGVRVVDALITQI